MIEKCTELGCELFCPIISERTDQSAINSYIGNIDASQSAMGNLYESQQGGGKGSSKKDLDKFALIGIEAAEQCERLTVPTFITSLALPLENTERMSDDCVIQLDDLVKEWIYEGQCKTLMVCRERKDSNDSFVLPVLEALNKHSTSSSEGVAFLIGPEGGWSLEEENLLDKYCAEHPTTIVGISLGSTVLRAETASIMAIGAWMVWKANSHNS
jgi:RsmE family RNA methyltransferase